MDRHAVGHSGRAVVESLAVLRKFSKERVQARLDYLRNRKAKAKAILAKSRDPERRDYLEFRLEEIELERNSLETGPSEPALQAIREDVEPYCEPMAFVLNDALSVLKPETIRPGLVDVAMWLPEGFAEPAWGDLVRTRRLHLLTDGASYVRAFLPGSNPEAAYESAYPVLRHALGWIDRATRGVEGLDIEVYAYTPDLDDAAFEMSLTPAHREIVGAGTPPKGTIPLDIARLKQFFEDGYRLNGAVIDGASQLVLVGSKDESLPTLDGIPISLSDLAVAYRAVAHSGLPDPYMSLDPSSNSAVAQVNFGGRLQDTLIGSVTLRSDVRFKTIATGYDAVLGDALDAALRKDIPDFSNQTERFVHAGAWSQSNEHTRYWFYPDAIGATTDGAGILLKRARFTAAAERTEAYDGEGNLLAKTTPPWTSDAIEHFNSNYDAFARRFLEVRELDDVARLLAVGAWLQDAAQKRGPTPDIDSLLEVEIPACRTPRYRPQLLVSYFVDVSTPVARIKQTFDLSHIARAHASNAQRVDGRLLRMEIFDAGKAAAVASGLVDAKRRLSSSLVQRAIIGGGLDLDMRKAVAAATTAAGDDAGLLVRARVIEQPGGQIGRAGWSTSKTLADVSPPSQPPRDPPHIGGRPGEHPEHISIGGGISERLNRDDVIVALDKSDSGSVQSWHVVRRNRGPKFEQSIWVDEHGSPTYVSRAEGDRQLSYHVERKESVVKMSLSLSPTAHLEDDVVRVVGAFQRGERLSGAWRELDSSSSIRAIERTLDGDVIIGWEEDFEVVGIRISAAGERTPLDSYGISVALADSARAKASAYSTDKVRLVALSNELDGATTVQIGRGSPLRIPDREWWVWDMGIGPIPPGIKKAAEQARRDGAELVLIRSPSEARPTRFAAEVEIQTAQLAARLGKAVSGLKVSIDDPSPEVATRAQSRRGVRRAADIGYAVLRDVPGTVDLDLFRVIESSLAQSGLKKIVTAADAASVSEVIVFAAHNNQQLFDYIQELGTHEVNGKSVLDGKTLMILTCFEEGNPNMFSEFIERFGCRIVTPTDRIDSVVLRPLLRRFLESTRRLNAKAPRTTARLLGEAAQAELKNAPPRRKEGLQPFMRLIEQLSDARNRRTPHVA